MPLVRADLHIHTRASPDASTSARTLIHACRQASINAVAVTDHNEIRGASMVRDLAPPGLRVIIGEEIRTHGGAEIVGLFLQQKVPAGLSLGETVSAIRSQGGLVYLPHPFERKHRVSRLSDSDRDYLSGVVDIVEVFNARNRDPEDNVLATEFASRHGLLRGAGSDAHTPAEIGNAWVEIEAFDSPAEFLRHLASAHVGGRRTPPLYRVATNRYVRRLLRNLP